MKRQILVGALLYLFVSVQLNGQPISIHPENPHYFDYRGTPTILITSAAHYGPVINGAFDYDQYLKTLHEDGMNYTRIFAGSYIEAIGAFGIEHNILAPQAEDVILPWKQVEEMGAYPNDKKFDLNQWNPAYFNRLKNFMHEADKVDIIVEVTFFSSIYSDKNWSRNPFNRANSVNDLPAIDRTEVHTLNNGKILYHQKEFVKKIVAELNGFDNVIYEIQNEPWSDQTREGMLFHKTIVPGGNKGDRMSELASTASYNWQIEMVNHIVQSEKSLPKKHLIAQNYCNQYHPLKEVNPAVAILNFHYAWAEASYLNYGWEKPISFDESGFSENSGMGDTTYLRQAWEFILAGGAVFNNLDYSFYCGSENGTKKNKAPGGGSKELRTQLCFLQEFMKSLNFLKMKLDFDVVYHAPGMRAQSLSEKGNQYAIVFTEMTNDWVKLNLPKANYHYTFYSPFTGAELASGNFKSEGKIERWKIPEDGGHMVSLKIIKR